MYMRHKHNPKEIQMAIIKIEGLPIMWAKMTEDDRDMGPKDGSDTDLKITAKQGQYTVDLMLDAEKKAEFISAGIPTKGLVGQNYKKNKNGEDFYYAKGPHFNPLFKDPDTGEQGVYIGPPKIWQTVDGEVVPWVIAEDGKLGNGTVVTAKFNVYKQSIVQLIGLMITEHVPYEGGGDDGEW
jgi:hypothetical protein